jgi:hypothetical protein
MMHTWRAVLVVATFCAVMGCGEDQPASKDDSPPTPGTGSNPNGKATKPPTGRTSGPIRLPMPVMTAQKARTYTHAAGFTFKYPADWMLKEHEDFLQLVPPNEKKNAQGPTEAYLITGDNVASEGISSPADPRVASYLDGKMRGISPTLAREGTITAVPTGSGKGTLYRWKGTNAKGEAITARAYTCIVKTWGIALIAVGLKGNVAARDEQVRKIFGSFAFGAGQKDLQLVGKWVLRSTYSLQNNSPFETSWSRAQMVSETRSWITFSADGSWKRLDKYHMLAGAGGLWIEDKKNTVTGGAWNAAGGTLFLTWKDGGWNDYKYKLDTASGSRRLRLVSGRKGEAWVPAK